MLLCFWQKFNATSRQNKWELFSVYKRPFLKQKGVHKHVINNYFAQVTKPKPNTDKGFHAKKGSKS